MRKRVFLNALAGFVLVALAVQYAAGPSTVAIAAEVRALRSTLPADVGVRTVLNTTTRHREWVHVPVGSTEAAAFIVYPERADKGPVVVLTSDNGASDWIRAVGDQIAAEGFIAVVPDVATNSADSTNALNAIEAVRRHALSLPSANGVGASLVFSSGITGDRVRAETDSPATGKRAASFRPTAAAWPQIVGFLNKETANTPLAGQNPNAPEDHTAHMAALAMLQPPAAPARAAQAGRGNQPVGYPQGKLPNLPAGRYTAKSTLAKSTLRKEFVDIMVGNVKLHTWVVYPEGNAPAPVMLVMQHGLGLDEWVRAFADQMAVQGFIAIAPDLFSGLGPNGGNWESFIGTDEVMRAAGGINQDEGIRRYKAAYDWGMKLPRANGKSASIGFCAGGGYAFRFAAEVPGINAAVSFYGGTPSEELMTKIKAPVLAFYGEDDARVTAAAIPTEAAMKRLGKSFEFHVYPHTTHAFLDYQSLGGNPAATADSWARTTAFLNQHVK